MEVCSVATTDTREPFGGGSTRQKTPSMYGSIDSSGVKECFKEYPLQDQIDALGNMMRHNEKHVRRKDKLKILMEDARDSVGVKECLKPEKRTPFGTVIWELRNTVRSSYWNKEVGKTRYQVANLPVGMDTVNTTFGKKGKTDTTVAELLKPTTIVKKGSDGETVHKMYRLTHHDYHPSERITRNYNGAFKKTDCFGKKSSGKANGSRLKSRISWPIDEVSTPNAKNAKRSVDINIAYGKPSVKEDYGAPKAIYEYLANEKELCLQRYMQHLNTLRLRFKRRLPEMPFLDVYQELIELDKDFKGILPEDRVYNVLAKYKMSVDKALFSPLLDLFHFREDGNIRYRELVNLLNWRFDIPTLPKLNTIPSEHQHYNTAYRDEISAFQSTREGTRAAGLPSSRWDLPFVCIPKAGIQCDRENLADQTIAYSLITPSIFTRYGLNHIDFFKTREKKEVRSIFENIGFEFSHDDFEKLWKEALIRDGNRGVCVETFKNLVSQKKDFLENKECL